MLKTQFDKLLAQIDVLIEQCEECKISSSALPTTLRIPSKADYNCKVLKINLNKNLKS